MRSKVRQSQWGSQKPLDSTTDIWFHPIAIPSWGTLVRWVKSQRLQNRVDTISVTMASVPLMALEDLSKETRSEQALRTQKLLIVSWQELKGVVMRDVRRLIQKMNLQVSFALSVIAPPVSTQNQVSNTTTLCTRIISKSRRLEQEFCREQHTYKRSHDRSDTVNAHSTT